MRKPSSGSAVAATSGTTRIAVLPFSFARLGGTVDAWYDGCANSRLTPPPPPNWNLPGGTNWYPLPTTGSKSSPHDVSKLYPPVDVTASDVPPTAVTVSSELG